MSKTITSSAAWCPCQQLSNLLHNVIDVFLCVFFLSVLYACSSSCGKIYFLTNHKRCMRLLYLALWAEARALEI